MVWGESKCVKLNVNLLKLMTQIVNALEESVHCETTRRLLGICPVWDYWKLRVNVVITKQKLSEIF